MRALLKSMVVPTLLMGWATCYFVEVMTKPSGGRTLILPAYLLLVVLYGAILLRGYRRGREATAQHERPSCEGYGEDRIRAICLAASLLYLIAIPHLGFPIATVLALSLAFHVLGAKRKIPSLLFAVCFTGILYFVFDRFLYVPLPLGLLEVLRGY